MTEYSNRLVQSLRYIAGKYDHQLQEDTQALIDAADLIEGLEYSIKELSDTVKELVDELNALDPQVLTE